MKPLFEVKEIDRQCYEAELRDFLPGRMIDIHTHVWLKEHRRHDPQERLVTSWPMRVAPESRVEELQETYRLMFPGKKVTPLIFSAVTSPNDLIDEANEYTAACMKRAGVPGLIWSSPSWSAAELDRRIEAGGFLGAKCYQSHAPAHIPAKDVTIYDFFPPHQVAELDRKGRIMMLHIPRAARLRDPDNIRIMLEIERKYPRLRLVIAHVGRAYCPEDIGNAFDALADTKRMCFDISANTNADTFERLLRAVGPRRVLFGSDLPILRMRMRRICENGTYVNLVPPGLYGDVSGDRNMREVTAAEGEKLTFFMYEELRAFKRAAERAGLSKADIEDVFHNNARRMIAGAGGKTDD